VDIGASVVVEMRNARSESAGRGEVDMLAAEIDFYEIFRVHPTAMALLTPDLEFIDVNDEFQAATGHPLEDIQGRNAFEVFPKNPHDAGALPKWTALEEAQSSGRHQSCTLTRYDLEDPANPGVFRERYWCTEITPLRGLDGHVEVLEFSAREITPIIAQFRELQGQEN